MVVYAIVGGWLLIVSQTASDVKGQYIFGQLSGAPMIMLMTFSGTIDIILNSFPWLNNIYVMFALSAVLVYAIGSVVGPLVQRLSAISRKNWERSL
ncbi:hypothetical protein [Bosea sp. 685]|uniref:hypothetical protein n=1 Tax=Bosea sp. 685 TaxID=3080057 RepID=UPI002892E663|nr:hypothetical protein [Bosea sp. 685]WNJ88154.1 hypothetical protein RMR04_17195 [Bosea sp. 685]